MTDRRIPSTAAVVLASAIGAAGMMAHNVLEFGPGFLGAAETLIPVGMFGLFALAAHGRGSWQQRPSPRPGLTPSPDPGHDRAVSEKPPPRRLPSMRVVPIKTRRGGNLQ